MFRGPKFDEVRTLISEMRAKTPDLAMDDSALSEIPWQKVSRPEEFFNARPRFRRSASQGVRGARRQQANVRPAIVVAGAASLWRSVAEGNALPDFFSLAEWRSLMSDRFSEDDHGRASEASMSTQMPTDDFDVFEDTDDDSMYSKNQQEGYAANSSGYQRETPKVEIGMHPRAPSAPAPQRSRVAPHRQRARSGINGDVGEFHSTTSTNALPRTRFT